MTITTVQFTLEELKLLASLTSDQLFRREFIDPKMPGYKANTAEIALGKSLVSRLRSHMDPNAPAHSPKKSPTVKHAM